MIIRQLESEMKSVLSWSPAVAILGPRQVGKTTLAKHIASVNAGAVYLDLENPDDQRKLEDGFNYLRSLQQSCVILDEIQLQPRLFSELRPLIDEKRTAGRFILLGSASPSLVKGVSESLAGRIAYLELTGLGLHEVSPNIDYKLHWFRGGFPIALLADNEAESFRWLSDFIRSYIERDLGHLFGVELSPEILRNFWSMLAHTNGNIWTAEVFARSLGVSAPTVIRYLSFLEGGYLVRKLAPWYVNAKKRLIKSPKIYIRDTGILHRLLNVSGMDELRRHPAIGGSWEGYVIEQVYQQKQSHLTLFYYRTQAGAECDLILAEGISVVACIEIKLSNNATVSRGFISCIDDLKPRYRYLITPQADTYTTHHEVVVTSLYHFITELLPNIK